MTFSRTHLIISFLFVLISYGASLTFDLTNIGLQNQDREIVTEGKAYISYGGIRLTPDKIGTNWSFQAGRAIYIKPLHLWDNRSGELASFATNFTFEIDSSKAKDYGDGLTFFLAENNSLITANGALGLPINPTTFGAMNRFVAVEFDTYWNSDWDPSMVSTNTSKGEHVGISISSLVSVKSQEWLFSVTSGGVYQAWITYDATLKILNVSFTGFRNNTVIRQDELVYMVDLRKELPEWVIFGFSAATGGGIETHLVRSWAFSSLDLKIDENNSLQPNPAPDPVNGKNNKVGLIVGLLVGITFVPLLVFILWRWKKKRNKYEAHAKLNAEFEMGNGPKRFSYRELAQSTSNFADCEKLGEGGFGGVYKGFLKVSNTYVAVKRMSKNAQQGMKEYESEVRIISQLRHRNLVQLIGWCHEKGELLLVYEYMEKGSLDLHLFKAKSLLTWGTRYKIAQGLASALLYLHQEWEQCVLHRDIKSSNVMLDSNFNAKLGDFGLAKLVDHEKGSQTLTILAGTCGYIAPECVVTGKASKESDVFSFGVVALEIACGKKPIENMAHENKIQLREWVWELYRRGSLLEAVDPQLGLDFEEEEVTRLLMVGLWCVHLDSELRPSMRQVIQVLNSEASLPMLPSNTNVTPYLTPSMSLLGVSNVDLF